MVLLNLVICIALLSVCNLSDALQHSFNVTSINSFDDSSDNQPKISSIDVKCSKDHNGMFVTIQFNQPFGGVIYSRNHFNDPKCRFVSDGENQETFSFVVPFKGCGSKTACSSCSSIENVLIIQHDEEVQSAFDIARKVSCNRIGSDEAKMVYFKPFVVDMLDVITIPTDNGSVNCWMDIQRGVYPKLSPIGNSIKIGEELTVMVYLQDKKNEFDLSVRNCWAYDSTDFDDDKTGKVQLSDASGCSMKKKLFGSWQKTSDASSTDATLLLHNVLKAFRFPDESQIYLKCDIEICRGTCAEAICDADFNQIAQIDCTADPLNAKCLARKYGDLSGTTPLPAITLNDRQQFENEIQSTTAEPTVAITTTIPFTISTRKPYAVEDGQQRFRYTSSSRINNDSDQSAKLIGRPSICNQDPTNIQCISPNKFGDSTTAIPNEETTTAAYIYQSDTDLPDVPSPTTHRNRFDILTFRPPMAFSSRINSVETIRNGETGASYRTPLICKIGQLDPRCPNPTPTATPPTYLPASFGIVSSPRAAISREPDVFTFKPTTFSPSYEYTTYEARTYPSRTYAPITHSPSTYAPTTYAPTTFAPTTYAPTTYIPSTTDDLDQTTTEKFFICVPGSNDYRCDDNFGKKTEDNEVITTTEIGPNGGIDVRTDEQNIKCDDQLSSGCKRLSSDVLTVRSGITTTAPFTTTTAELTTETPTTEKQPDVTTTRFTPTKDLTTTSRSVPTEPSDVTTVVTSRPVSTTRPPICYPGALDPRCKDNSRPFKAGPPRNMNSIISFGTLNQQQNINNEEDFNAPPNTQSRFNVPQTPDTVYSFNGQGTPFKSNGQNTQNQIPSTSKPLNCYFGSLDPRCQRSTTKKPAVETAKEQSSTAIPIRASTTQVPAVNNVPDVETPKQNENLEERGNIRVPSDIETPASNEAPEERANVRISSEIAAPTPNAIPEERANFRIPSEVEAPTPNEAPYVRANLQIPSKTQTPTCYPGSRNPLCKAAAAGQPFGFASSTASTTTRPYVGCYPGSLDSRCKPVVANYNQLNCNQEPRDPRCPSNSPSFQAATYLPPFADSHTERTFQPSTSTIGFNGRPTFSTDRSSNDLGSTTRFYEPSTPQAPTSRQPQQSIYISTTGPTSTTTTTTTTSRPTPFIPSTTSRRIYSSPQPFNTRPTTTTTTTTENPLCYPGSPIAGCQSSITTPSFCYPGSKDKRCPQLPETFSTRVPSTYLPPYFPDIRINRVKRQLSSTKNEIVHFSMSFKPYSVN